MVDYQYQIDMNDPVAKLRLAMDNMDGTSLWLSSHFNVSYWARAQSNQ